MAAAQKNKRARKPNWARIQAEYVTGQISQRELAKKHGVSYGVLAARCRDEGWVAQRSEYRSETVAKAVEKIGAIQSDQMALEMTAAAGELLAMVREGIRGLNRPVRSHKYKVEGDDGSETTTEWLTQDDPNGIVDMKGAKAAGAALRDVYAILGLKTELERQEQEARIAALRAKAAQADGNEPGEITVTFDAGPEEWNE